MRILWSAGALICAALAILAQSETGLKHLVVAPANSNRTVSLTAQSIERGGHYPSRVRLKGNVEIKTVFCVPGGPCAGELVVRADEATFHEDTGDIEPNGHVVVQPRIKP